MPDSTASQFGDNPKTHLMLGRIFAVVEMLLTKTPADEAGQPLSEERDIYQKTELPVENHALKKSMYSPVSR